jgi:hypothetical protein
MAFCIFYLHMRAKSFLALDATTFHEIESAVASFFRRFGLSPSRP